MKALLPIAFAGALAAGTATSFQPLDGTKVGDAPSHEFRSAILDGLGAKSLADFRGRPTLIDFWGTR